MPLNEAEELELLDLERNRAIALVRKRREEPAQPTLGENIQEDLARRESTAQETLEAQERGEIGAIQSGFQRGGQTLLAGVDVLGETAKAGFEKLPEPVQEPLEALGRVAGATVGRGVRNITDLAEATVGRLPAGFGGEGTVSENIREELQDPNVQRNIAALTAFGLSTVRRAPGLKELGAATTKSGVKKSIGKRKEFVDELVRPLETPKDIAARSEKGQLSEKGITRKRVIGLSKSETAAAEIVDRLPVKKNQSLTLNQNVVIEAIDKEAVQLGKNLERLGEIFPRTEVKARLNKKMGELIENNAFLVGNAENIVVKLRGIIDSAIDANPGTAAGLLNARKQIDAELRRQTKTKSGSDIFDSTADKAVNVAISDMRAVINDFIAEKAPGAGVKKSLKEQSLLFQTRDNLSPKVGREKSDLIRRAVKKIDDAIPSTGLFLKTAGTITLGVKELLALPFRGVLSATVRKDVGALISGLDRLITIEKDAGVLRQLRVDRVLLIEMLNEENE